MSTGTITTWGSCDPASNGYQTAKDSITGPSGEQLTEVENVSGVMTWKRTNVWIGNDLIATYNATGLHFFFNDWLGTRRVQTDYAGVVQQTCTNMPYGNGLTCGNSLEFPTENHFTGKQRDSETGNDYFGARYYSSDTGRFLTPDPSGLRYADLANPQSLDLYNYVGNRPLTLVDLEGLCWKGFKWACSAVNAIKDFGVSVKNKILGNNIRAAP